MTAATRFRIHVPKTFVKLGAAALALAVMLLPTAATGAPEVGVVIKTPVAGASISGSTHWLAEITDGKAKTVDFYVDGVKKWTELGAPYEYNLDSSNGRLDTTKLSNGTHELMVVANHPGGSTATARHTVTVANLKLGVTIKTPSSGATISGDTPWLAEVSNGTARTVDFYIDGVKKWTEQSAPYEYNLDSSNGRIITSRLADGRHELKVVANGTDGTIATASHTVTVANGSTTTPPPPPPPSSIAVTIETPLTGATISGSTPWLAKITSGTAKTVDFYIDGVKRHTELTAPYEYNVDTQDGRIDTTKLTNGLHQLKVVANAADGQTAAQTVSVTVANGTPTGTSLGAPVNTTAPVISGTASVGQVLSATTGAWTGTEPMTYTRAWQRCSDLVCEAISGALASTYTVTSSDLGSSIRHVVTATNAAGTASAPSSKTAPVVSTPTTTSVDTNLGTALPARMPQSTGQSYYVSTTGSDANPGTLAAPWRTINKALASVPLTGSIINVRAGTYVGMHQFVNRYGNTSNPVTLQPYPGERVVLTAPSGAQLHAVLVSKAGGIRIQGFEITSPGALDGLKVENGRDVEVTGNEIHHTGRQGLTVAGSGSTAPTNSRNVQVWNNRFYANGSTNQFDHSLYWGAVSSNSDGIDHGAQGGVIANNLFYNQSHGFQLQIGSQANGLIVTNNTFYRSAAAYPVGSSIALYTESATAAYVTRNVLIVNNLITHAAYKGVYGSGGGGLMATNTVRNNLAFGNGGGDFTSYYGSTSNVLYTLGSNITGQSPLFVNPSGLDFRIQAGSPAIGKADPAYAPARDFSGRSRSGAPDLGAFEH